MAIDKGTTNMQDVDLDDLEVVILIIAKNPAKITQASNFLTRRGWPTTVMNNLSHAIEFASDRKPDFVLISVNHPNPAISKFSELLTTTFGTTCVGFAETMDTASGARLAKSLLQLKIQGQASGPNLHRSLRKILAEKLNIQLDDKGQAQERAPSGDRNVTVKGGTAGDAATMVQKNEPGVSQSKGPTMIKGEGGGTSAEGKYENESISSGKYTITKRTRRSLKELSQNPLDKPGDVVMGEASAIAAQLKRSLFGDSAETESPEVTENENDSNAAAYRPAFGEDGNDEAFGSDDDDSENSDSAENGSSVTSRRSASGKKPGTSVHQDAVTQNAAKAVGTGPLTANSQNAPHGGAIGHPGYRPGSSSAKSNAPGESSLDAGSFANAAQATPNEKKTKGGSQKKSLESVGPHSIIERAVQEAIREIARPGNAGHAALNLIQQVGVFPIDSPSLPGYLVLAWPHEEMSAIEPFFKLAQTIIANKFKKTGVQASLEPGFFVMLPQVEFATWAQESSSFFFSTAHGNEEIGVAFFATQKPIPKPKQIEDKTMYSIDLENISTEQPVNFKVYLHMKKNKKYFLYLRNGRQLQPEQKQRLEGNKVKDLYMKTIDVENLRMFLASCHLRQKIKKVG